MAYEIRYTDTVNKGSIVIEDSTLNSETSLKLPGRFTTAYGQAVSENFLHLLENFANDSAPTRPVEGQIWYDTSTSVNQLKVYDGTNWVAAGGLKKASSEPAVATSLPGDLWVNTDSQQLYLFTGSAWVLVGPQFSDGLLTGAQAQNIIGTDDIGYNVLAIKVEDQPVAIISSQAFTPKTALKGFRSGINAGINISVEPLVGTQVLKYFGTSEKAENLVVAGVVVPASNFLRGNASSTTNFDLNVKNNEGVTIGTGGQLTIGVDGEAGLIQHNTSGANIDFRLRNGTLTPTVVRIDAQGLVGFNNSAPEQAIDVSGNIRIATRTGEPDSGYLQITSTIDSTDLGVGSILTAGGAAIAKNVVVGGDLNMIGEGNYLHC
jgi:hypothetical protein